MAKLPLSHIKVLDLTAHRAGPTAVRQLADWGAQVIKIEPPPEPGSKTDAMGGSRHGFDFQNLHRNKQAITLNLKSKEGHAIFMKLAKKADVIVENYRSDVKYRLKVDYKSVKKVNPKIVYGSIAGFGQDGPDAARPGVDQIAQGMGGLMSITGEPGRGPMRVGIPICDLTAGLLLAQAITLALYNRERTKKGQWVHTSLIEAQIFMLDFQAARWLMKNEVAKQAGNDHPTSIPTGVFPTERRLHQHRRRRRQDVAALRQGGRRRRAARPSRARHARLALAEPQGAERAHQRGHQDQHLGALDRGARTRPACPAGRSTRST